MGKEKALLSFAPNVCFLQHLLETYFSTSIRQVVLVVNQQNYAALLPFAAPYTKVKLIVNPHPEKGRMQSVLLGLQQTDSKKGVFVQNIDNPFVHPELLRGLMENYAADSYVVPRYEQQNGHPILLGEKLVSDLCTYPADFADFKCFLQTYTKRFFVSTEKTILANVNSPEQYEYWFPKNLA